jgi:hypothetical protein
MEFWYTPNLEVPLSDDTWNYVKRPIVRITATRAEVGQQVIWPGLASIIDQSDDIHSVIPATERQRIRKYTKQFLRTLEHAERVGLDQDDITLLKTFNISSLVLLGYLVKNERNFRVPASKYISIIPPPIDYDGNMFLSIRESISSMVLEVPETSLDPICPFVASVGATSRLKSTKCLNFLCNLGFMEKTMVKRECIGDRDWDYIYATLFQPDKREKIVYEYIVLSPLPFWSFDVFEQEGLVYLPAILDNPLDSPESFVLDDKVLSC